MTDFSKDFNLDFRQETMDIIQMRKYVDLEIFKQGSASAKVLAPLFTAIIDKLASTSVDDGQVSTVAITIEEPAKTGYSVLNMFDSCARLISFKIKNLAQDLDLHWCTQVSPESILYTVQNAKPDASFLITLETSVLEKYNSSADWAEVCSAVEANSKIVIA